MSIERLIKDFITQGYKYIYDDDTRKATAPDNDSIEVSEATCREFDRVVMLLDDSFTYDDKGYLRSVTSPDLIGNSVVRDLFHGLSRAKEKIAIVVRGNKPVFKQILTILQGDMGKSGKD